MLLSDEVEGKVSVIVLWLRWIILMYSNIFKGFLASKLLLTENSIILIAGVWFSDKAAYKFSATSPYK